MSSPQEKVLFCLCSQAAQAPARLRTCGDSSELWLLVDALEPKSFVLAHNYMIIFKNAWLSNLICHILHNTLTLFILDTDK